MTAPPASTMFVMYGARAAMAAGLSHISEQVKGIERSVLENPGLAFDLAKTVVESACRTILTEREILFGVDDDLPKLFKTVTVNLPMLPVGASSETDARRSLVQTLNGLHTSLQGVCELRNAYGFASHGDDGLRPTLESAQALLAAQAADAIVGFLYGVHRQERNIPAVRMEFEKNSGFNTYVDEANVGVRIFELSYRPSEVLFAVDIEAYREILSGYRADGEAEVSPPEESSGNP